MDYKQEDFKECFINPFSIEEGFIFSQISTFENHKEFKLSLPKDVKLWKVLRYITCLYQDNSPLISIDNVLKRKLEAANISKFDKKDKVFLQPYSDIMNCNNHTVNNMILRFCRSQHNPKFLRLMLSEEYHALEFTKYREEEDATKRKAILQNIETLGDDIERLTNEYLQGDNNKNITKSLFEAIELEELDITPEDIAEKRMTGDKLDDFSPYGKEYKIGKLTYIPDKKN